MAEGHRHCNHMLQAGTFCNALGASLQQCEQCEQPQSSLLGEAEPPELELPKFLHGLAEICGLMPKLQAAEVPAAPEAPEPEVPAAPEAPEKPALQPRAQ